MSPRKRSTTYLKAIRKGSRDAELSFEHGWKCRHKIHRSKKSYTRKVKFRGSSAE